MSNYTKLTANQPISSYLFSPKTLTGLHRLSLEDRIRFIETRITKEELLTIKRILHLDFNQLSRILHITNRCMHMKRKNDLFSVSVSDRIMALLELYSFGYEIMGGYSDFHQWMLQPSERLLGKCPLEIIGTHSGILAVRDALLNIQFGHL